MEKLLIGLADFSIKKVISCIPALVEATYTRETLCPACGGSEKRIKASFWRESRSVPQPASIQDEAIVCSSKST